MNEKIFVTRPTLPSLDMVYPYLERIWDSKILTNNGPLHQEFEQKLCDYLGVNYVSLFCNATIALLVALKALDLKGTVITTPYSFVATSNALIWNGLKPKFIDINLSDNNLDPNLIENNLDETVSAILAVHCYGIPCDVKKIKKISEKHNLKVIYDAAHSFGSNYADDNIFNYGDLSVLSFHATKVFNTFEGGCIISHSENMKHKIDQLKNFGFINEEEVILNGINGKLSEINSAIGLCQLNLIDEYIIQRKELFDLYRNKLSNKVGLLNIPQNLNYNYSYFPVFFKSEKIRNHLYDQLKLHNIYARKYFYPTINNFEFCKEYLNETDVSNSLSISNTVLCLPIYPSLGRDEALKISNLILDLI